MVGIKLNRHAIGFKRSIERFGISGVVPTFDVVSLPSGEPLDMLEGGYRKFIDFFLPAEVVMHDAQLREGHRESRVELHCAPEVRQSLLSAIAFV